MTISRLIDYFTKQNFDKFKEREKVTVTEAELDTERFDLALRPIKQMIRNQMEIKIYAMLAITACRYICQCIKNRTKLDRISEFGFKANHYHALVIEKCRGYREAYPNNHFIDSCVQKMNRAFKRTLLYLTPADG